MDEKCVWKADRDYDSAIYETECGEAFIFDDGNPVSNNFIYCPYCGKMINDQTELWKEAEDV